MLIILAIIGIIIILCWLAIIIFLFSMEFYIQSTILNTKKLQIQSERTITNLLNEVEVKRRDSFIPPKATDEPIFKQNKL